MANSNQNIETPKVFVKELERFFDIKFAFDMAASPTDHKAPMYFREEENSLTIKWPTSGWCFLNPPFKRLTKWINKCSEESKAGARIVSIWPLSGDLNQIKVWKEADVYIVHGRLWPEVRSIVVCVWDTTKYYVTPSIRGLRWGGAILKEEW